MTASQHPANHAAAASKPVTEEAILKVAKEVVLKFIEVGRLSPANFKETFSEIYTAVRSTVKDAEQ